MVVADRVGRRASRVESSACDMRVDGLLVTELSREAVFENRARLRPPGEEMPEIGSESSSFVMPKLNVGGGGLRM